MTLTVKINTDNDAFDPPGLETARILRELADYLLKYHSDPDALEYANGRRLMDANGNHVGNVELTS